MNKKIKVGLFGISMFVLGVMSFMLINTPFSFLTLFEENRMDVFAKSNMNDNFTIDVAEICSIVENKTQVECVVTQVSNYYNYTDRNDTFDFKTPSEFKEGGGVCRDVAVTYVSIFKKLGWTTTFRFIPNHVYVTIYNEGVYCNIDGKIWDCI